MTANPPAPAPQPDVEIAAGGLVVHTAGDTTLLGIVYRAGHRDVTLPKGRREAGETALETATREAQEELGWRVRVGSFAGSYGYEKEGRPKTVLIWHMTRGLERYPHPAEAKEIGNVVWLPPEEAIARLSHATEADFVARHFAGGGDLAPGSRRGRGPELARLSAAIGGLRERLVATLRRSPPAADAWWPPCVQRSLERAEAARRRRDIDGGWSAVHQGERFLVFGLGDAALLGRAISLRSEVLSDKLPGWRRDAAASLFKSADVGEWIRRPALAPDDRKLLEHVVAESLFLLDERSQNVYHRVRLVGKQLRYLIAVGGVLLAAVLALLGWSSALDPQSFGLPRLLAVALFGGLGAVVSAVHQLSRVGQSKIPESTLHGVVTSGRPLIGALSALFVYALLKSGTLSLIAADAVNLPAALAFAFVSGFSERFVVQTVGAVAGDAGPARKEPPRGDA